VKREKPKTSSEGDRKRVGEGFLTKHKKKRGRKTGRPGHLFGRGFRRKRAGVGKSKLGGQGGGGRPSVVTGEKKDRKGGRGGMTGLSGVGGGGSRKTREAGGNGNSPGQRGNRLVDGRPLEGIQGGLRPKVGKSRQRI